MATGYCSPSMQPSMNAMSQTTDSYLKELRTPSVRRSRRRSSASRHHTSGFQVVDVGTQCDADSALAEARLQLEAVELEAGDCANALALARADLLALEARMKAEEERTICVVSQNKVLEQKVAELENQLVTLKSDAAEESDTLGDDVPMDSQERLASFEGAAHEQSSNSKANAFPIEARRDKSAEEGR